MNGDAGDRAYLVGREQQERLRGDRATDRASAAVHHRLADLYAERVREIDRARSASGPDAAGS